MSKCLNMGHPPSASTWGTQQGRPTEGPWEIRRGARGPAPISGKPGKTLKNTCLNGFGGKLAFPKASSVTDNHSSHGISPNLHFRIQSTAKPCMSNPNWLLLNYLGPGKPKFRFGTLFGSQFWIDISGPGTKLNSNLGKVVIWALGPAQNDL